MNRVFIIIFVCLFAPNSYADKSSFETYGDYMKYVLPVGAGVIALAKKDTHGFVEMGLSTGLTMATVGLLKETVSKERPNGKNDNSFPSGHAAAAFSGAANLHYRYGWQYGLPAYALAFSVGASRVDADKHYWEDIFASLVIANVWSYVFIDSMPNTTLLPGVDLQKKNFHLIFSHNF